MEEYTRSKQTTKLKKSTAAKRAAKVKLFLEPPKAAKSRRDIQEPLARHQNTAVCKREQLRLESEPDEDENIKLVALNRDHGLQQYLNCKAQYK